MIQQIAVLGDVTNYGGRIITASGNGYCGIDGIALLGDLASCPKCRSTGRIIEGANDFVIDGKPVAYDGCIIACKCTPVGGHRIIALKSTVYINISNNSLSNSSQSNSIINKQEINQKIADNWIGFQIDSNKDYSGLNFIVTLNNGQLLKGTFDQNNKARLTIDTQCDSARIEIESLENLGDDNNISSITENLLKTIIG
ncbi:PAAR domain-containing protein [Gilliamella sp. B14384G15]|uniref:PAAR domain-containing protein n=1 Tax=unclassified Gilliamella TaxID=2685620 RepID=UPI0018DCC147|nr:MULTISPECIES: PAAR domain-containing protein [unclassified Gilliamella]MBI0032154.1 PAAR domain-containing protein [Gilliamella sp. B14384G15]MBI0059468.1 PAAR domain-containing protein [Gilliamella sp. B14384G12]